MAEERENSSTSNVLLDLYEAFKLAGSAPMFANAIAHMVLGQSCQFQAECDSMAICAFRHYADSTRMFRSRLSHWARQRVLSCINGRLDHPIRRSAARRSDLWQYEN